MVGLLTGLFASGSVLATLSPWILGIIAILAVLGGDAIVKILLILVGIIAMIVVASAFGVVTTVIMVVVLFVFWILFGRR